MPIYDFQKTKIVPLQSTSFSANGVRERYDLQRLLRDNISVIAADTLIISEEYRQWEDSKRSIDLLAVDRDANLVVIELKRTEDGGHMELQAIRYAAMVSTMTFALAVDAFSKHLKKLGRDEDARTGLLDFLGWDDPSSGEFAEHVRIVLAAADFSKEITSTAIWLNANGLDVRCVRLVPYKLDERLLVDVQQIVPVPEAEDYQVKIREKNLSDKREKLTNIDFTKFDVTFGTNTTIELSKRAAIYHIVRHLCDNGTNPEEIALLFPWRATRVWFWVSGDVSSSEFEAKAAERAASMGQTFRSRRWFCESYELIRSNNKTYAFSNQWGGDGWHKAMDALKTKFAEFKISYTAEPDDESEFLPS